MHASCAASQSENCCFVFEENRITPERVNCHKTLPGPPKDPPCFDKRCFTSETVRLVLSVTVSIRTATPPGPNPSYKTSCNSAVSVNSPVPRLIARSIFSLGTFVSFALILCHLECPLIYYYYNEAPKNKE